MPGTGKALLDLIQSKEVSAAAIFGASAMSASGASAQPGLAQLAAACGWAPVLNAAQNEVVTLAGVADGQSAACTGSNGGLWGGVWGGMAWQGRLAVCMLHDWLLGLGPTAGSGSMF